MVNLSTAVANFSPLHYYIEQFSCLLVKYSSTLAPQHGCAVVLLPPPQSHTASSAPGHTHTTTITLSTALPVPRARLASNLTQHKSHS